jgi:hypothetical protein
VKSKKKQITMKIKIIMTGMVIMVLSMTNLIAQDSPDDRRRTAQEQAAYEKTIKVNPAKIDAPTVDSRMYPAEATAAPVIWKPLAMEPEMRPAESELPAAQSVVTPSNKEVNSRATQPAPDPAQTVINRKSMIGPKEQPAANPQGVKNRRDMVGPKTQPQPQKTE